MSATITLPWPSKALHAHAKGHWRPKAAATKAYRRVAWLLALEARVTPDPAAVLAFTYHPPDLRRRDCQNMPQAMKAVVDGIADAMNCDDNKFRVRYPEAFGDPVKGGRIVVEVGAN